MSQLVTRPAEMSPSSTLSAGTFVKLKWMRFKVDGAVRNERLARRRMRAITVISATEIGRGALAPKLSTFLEEGASYKNTISIY